MFVFRGLGYHPLNDYLQLHPFTFEFYNFIFIKAKYIPLSKWTTFSLASPQLMDI